MKTGNRKANEIEAVTDTEVIYMNPGYQVRFDFTEEQIEDGRFFNYSYVNVKAKTRKDIIIAIIRSEYDMNDEFAAINEGGERHATFLKLRSKAEQIADKVT